jgi:hypothetical protein
MIPRLFWQRRLAVRGDQIRILPPSWRRSCKAPTPSSSKCGSKNPNRLHRGIMGRALVCRVLGLLDGRTRQLTVVRCDVPFSVR